MMDSASDREMDQFYRRLNDVADNINEAQKLLAVHITDCTGYRRTTEVALDGLARETATLRRYMIIAVLALGGLQIAKPELTDMWKILMTFLP